MRKLLTVVLLLCFVGAAGAAMVKNPEDFEDYAIGTPPPGWESWGSGSGAGGWGGPPPQPLVADDGTGNQVLQILQDPSLDSWTYNLAFSHNNPLVGLPVNNVVPIGYVRLEYDVMLTAYPGGSNAGIAKIEFYDAAAGQLSVAAWDPLDLTGAEGSWRHIIVEAPVPAGVTTVTPVIGLTGPGTEAVYDNVYLSTGAPEPATLLLLGLGGLLIRKRK